MGIAPGLQQPPEGAWVIGDEPYGGDVTEESMKAMYRGQANAGFGQGADGFRNGIMGGFGSIGNILNLLFSAITGGSGLGGIFGSISNFLGGKWIHVDTAVENAEEAIAAATAADNKITAILGGGTRTIRTSSFTYTKPANLVKLGIIIINGGGAGTYGSYGGAGGTGGGYVYYEYPASAIPASVSVTVAAGRPNGQSASQAPNISSFGTLQGATTNAGAIILPSGALDATPSRPGSGGTSGVNNDNPNGTAGGSSILAAGGAGGNASTISGANGANAPVDQQYLAGGGGGGGGRALTAVGASSGPGGAGGFPGGAGGAGGRDSFSTYNGGPGAPGLVATIEYLS